MFSHIPVLLNETIENLNIDKDKIYVDATIGGGGHTSEILKRLEGGTGFVIGIDQDIDAINAIRENFSDYIDNRKLILVQDNFENIDIILKNLNIDKIDGILFDLGVSSHQFDTGERGFSYRFDAPLDMRMNTEAGITCKEIVNTYPENEIYHIIRDYGEENFAKNIAKHIVIEREKQEITTTFQLVEIIKNAIPAKCRYGEGLGKNPAKKTFQAFRIYVNDELKVIDVALDKVVDLLNKNGRIAVITFHSLEDRIVKEKFRYFENPCTCPKGYPCVCGKKTFGKIVNRKVIIASDEELLNNNRAKPAKLRIFERG